MARISVMGFIERKPHGCRNKGGNYYDNAKVYRDWFLVKHTEANIGAVYLPSQIHVPPEFIGKKVRFKIEVLQ